MNGFLVVARCTPDDIPIRLCNSLEEARDYCLKFLGLHEIKQSDGDEGLSMTGYDELKRISVLMTDNDPSDFYCINIVEFVDDAPKEVFSCF